MMSFDGNGAASAAIKTPTAPNPVTAPNVRTWCPLRALNKQTEGAHSKHHRSEENRDTRDRVRRPSAAPFELKHVPVHYGNVASENLPITRGVDPRDQRTDGDCHCGRDSEDASDPNTCPDVHVLTPLRALPDQLSHLEAHVSRNAGSVSVNGSPRP